MKKIFMYVMLCFLLYAPHLQSAPAFVLWFIAKKHANCPQALPILDKSFCPFFKTVASCHCVAAGLPKSMCQNMNSLYQRMVFIFGSVQKACEYQKDTSTQRCLDDWHCYRQGGTDSHHQRCSGTGSACEA